MKIDINQYLTQINKEDVINKNAIECCDSENRRTILIRNSEPNTESVSFDNEFFIMKNNFVLEIDNNEIGNFHILICKRNDENSKDHFMRVCNQLFLRSNQALSAEEMLKLFYSLETIFATTSSNDKTLEIGLYGELSVINFLYQKNLSCYKMWHGDFFNKHDFELDSNTKIEVKTTVKESRKHTFSFDQLYRNKLNIYIISSKLKICEKGLSLYELCNETMNILDDRKQMLALELLMKKLGLTNKYQGINCVPAETYGEIKIFNAKDIPVLTRSIPDAITNVHFDVDFSGIKESSFDDIRR